MANALAPQHMSFLRVIPAYRHLEDSLHHQETENRRLLLQLDQLTTTHKLLSDKIASAQEAFTELRHQYEALVTKPKPRHLIFFHLLRTGGSSTWKALSEAASRQGLPVCDIYHQARSLYGNNTAVHSAMYDLQQFVRSNDCLIHHHTPFCLAPYFDHTIHYTTILRDPVDRFISEVNHTRHLLAGDIDSVHMAGQISPKAEVIGLGWPQELIDMAQDQSVDLSSLLLHAAKHPHFSRYYTVWFNRLLDPELSKQPYEKALASNIDSPALSNRIKSAFSYIGSFKNLSDSIQAIGSDYGLRNVDTSGWINKRCSETLMVELRPALKPFLAKDYELIQSLAVEI